MLELEEELQHPTGLTTIMMPELSVDFVLLSRDCGIMYKLDHTFGIRSALFGFLMTWLDAGYC
jgi:transmembrane E3 ubiquitin-protein ligase